MLKNTRRRVFFLSEIYTKSSSFKQYLSVLLIKCLLCSHEGKELFPGTII
jgi:hypothetical protein